MNHLASPKRAERWLFLAIVGAILGWAALRFDHAPRFILVWMPCKDGGGGGMMAVDAGTAWTRHAPARPGSAGQTPF